MTDLENEILKIIREVWCTLFDLEISLQDNAQDLMNALKAVRSVTSCVQVTGAFEGAVLVHCSYGFARSLAAIMFDLASEELSDEEVEDATGEIGNIVAGNIKLLLPTPSNISLPAVIDGIDYRLLVPGSEIHSCVSGECGGEPLQVTLLQKGKSH